MSLVVETMAEIGVTRVSRWIFNCYVIHDRGEGRPVIVDAGLPRLADDLPPVLADLTIDPAAVAAIVATHGHSDHVGGTSALSSRLGVPALPGHGRTVHGNILTALALGPAEGPRGPAAFGCALARYVTDRGPSYGCAAEVGPGAVPALSPGSPRFGHWPGGLGGS